MNCNNCSATVDYPNAYQLCRSCRDKEVKQEAQIKANEEAAERWRRRVEKMKNLQIKKSEYQTHPDGTLWTFANPHEEMAFKHFTNGNIAIIESRIDNLVYIASLHGWTVTKVQ